MFPKCSPRGGTTVHFRNTTRPPWYIATMVSLDTCRALAQALPDVSEQLHHNMPAFARGTKRFAIFDPAKRVLALRLSLTDSDRIEAVAAGLLEPAPGKYGAEGWAAVDLERIGKEPFATLLAKAHAGAGAKSRRS